MKKIILSLFTSTLLLSLNAQNLDPGNPAPDFTLKNNQRDTLSLSDFRGKVVYLQFWASWCAVCKQQIPYTKLLQNELQGKDVVFLYISVDENQLD